MASEPSETPNFQAVIRLNETLHHHVTMVDFKNCFCAPSPQLQCCFWDVIRWCRILSIKSFRKINGYGPGPQKMVSKNSSGRRNNKQKPWSHSKTTNQPTLPGYLPSMGTSKSSYATPVRAGVGGNNRSAWTSHRWRCAGLCRWVKSLIFRPVRSSRQVFSWVKSTQNKLVSFTDRR